MKAVHIKNFPETIHRSSASRKMFSYACGWLCMACQPAHTLCLLGMSVQTTVEQLLLEQVRCTPSTVLFVTLQALVFSIYPVGNFHIGSSLSVAHRGHTDMPENLPSEVVCMRVVAPSTRRIRLYLLPLDTLNRTIKIRSQTLMLVCQDTQVSERFPLACG